MSARKSNGNMLVLSGVFVALNAVGLILACSFGSLFFVHNRLQSSSDELALVGARKLNEQDRIGQMNNMIARSRQLVYDAAESRDTADSHLAQLSTLADKLHMEGREGAMLLEDERKKLQNVSKNEAIAAIMTRFTQIRDGHVLVLPWLQVSVPVTPSITFGCTEKVQSNVKELKGIEELSENDSAYVAADGSHLYKNNIDAKVPGPDADLHFRISSLPAPVAGSIAPARAVLAKVFQSSAPEQLYSTVKVELQLDVDTMLGASAHSTMQTIGTAEATGGQLML